MFASHGSYIVYIVSYTIHLITTCNPLFPDAGTNQDIKRGKSEERVSYSTTIKVKCINYMYVNLQGLLSSCFS